MSKKRLFSFIAAALFFVVALWTIFDGQIDRGMYHFLMRSGRWKYTTYGTNFGMGGYYTYAQEDKAIILLGDLLCALPTFILAIIFLVKGCLEEDKVPAWLLYAVIGVNMVFPMVIRNEHILWDKTLGEGLSLYGSLIVGITVIIFLALKKKTAKVFFLPSLWYAFFVICAIADNASMERTVEMRQPPVYPVEILLVIAMLLVQGAAWFFALWVLIKENIVESSPQKVATETNAPINMETATESAASETASAASAPKLTQRQQEDLANAKELFELGAYSEEEFEAEKQRIMLGL